MKTYQPQYDGVDWVSETIRHIVNLAEIGGPIQNSKTRAAANHNGTDISDWTDILASNPSWYLRLALTMDMALSKNRMPEEHDFPVGLRSLFADGFGANRNLLIDNDNRAGNEGNEGNVYSTATANADATRPVNLLHSDIVGRSYPTAAAAAAAPDLPASTGPMMHASVEDVNTATGDARFWTAAAANGITASGACKGDILAGDCSSGFPMMHPHHLAMSMGVAMGMDIDLDKDLDMDFIEMDMDMGFSALSTPGVVTQLPSSDEELSPPVSASSESSSHTGDGCCSPSATSLDAPGSSRRAELDDEHDWIEQAWDADGSEMREGDRDTARALLEAMDST